jgi:hypothetical protein
MTRKRTITAEVQIEADNVAMHRIEQAIRIEHMLDPAIAGDLPPEIVGKEPKGLGWGQVAQGLLDSASGCPQTISAKVSALIRYYRAARNELAPLQKKFDLIAHIMRQRSFSMRTFGPGTRMNAVIDHIEKELAEVRDSHGDIAEWADVIILAMDGAWRAGYTPQEIVEAIVEKQTKNENRTWPDWRTSDPDKAIEHDRTGETAP